MRSLVPSTRESAKCCQGTEGSGYSERKWAASRPGSQGLQQGVGVGGHSGPDQILV